MTEKIALSTEEDEISLLDILLTLAESWKLLVFGPLLAGVLAGAISFLLPKTFESISIVRLTEEQAALIHAAPVLDPLIEKFDLLKDADGFLDDARQNLKRRLTFVVDRKTKLVTFVAQGRTPESAQMLGKATMDILLIELQPKGKEKEAILQEIEVNKQLIADGIYWIQRQPSVRLNKDGGNFVPNDAKGQIANLKVKNLELSLKLQSMGKEVFAQEPSLPMRKSSPNQIFMVFITVLAVGFVLLVFIFLRSALRLAAKDLVGAAKLQKIREYF